MSRFLLIDNHNFVDYPVGGTLTFARHLMRLYKNRMALVGIAGDGEPVGCWSKKNIDGMEFDYFAFRREGLDLRKGILPKRVLDFFALLFYMRRIRSLGCREVLTQLHTAAMALSFWKWDLSCVRLTGLANIVQFSKFNWVKPFGRIYEWTLFRILLKASYILATADEKAIANFVGRSGGVLSVENLIQFPTRIDLSRIPQVSIHKAREMLDFPMDRKIILYCARISWPKGWDLVLQGFAKIASADPKLLLLVVGDGEDSEKFKDMAVDLGVENQIIYVGRQSPDKVISYYQAADVFAIGSHVEGWSNAMLEALATGTAMVSTTVSGAKDMIRNGENGYVIESRDPADFADAIQSALALPHVERASREIVQHYTVETIADDFSNIGLWT